MTFAQAVAAWLGAQALRRSTPSGGAVVPVRPIRPEARLPVASRLLYHHQFRNPSLGPSTRCNGIDPMPSDGSLAPEVPTSKEDIRQKWSIGDSSVQESEWPRCGKPLVGDAAG